MTTNNSIMKKNITSSGSVQEFVVTLLSKQKLKNEKLEKIPENKISIPTIKTYSNLLKYNYNLSQLKIFAKHYKLKISGNKSELIGRIYNFLHLSWYAITIQKVFRGHLVKKYKEVHGPACLNRKLCVNNDDFITMEPVEDIKYHQFISYKDIDGFIYGFDITSLHNLIIKSDDDNDIKNPYNRNHFPVSLFQNIKLLIRLSKMLKIDIILDMENDNISISNEKTIELRAIGLFQEVNSLGNYSNSDWFLSLSRNLLIKFIRELMEIWHYRAQLSLQVKRSICPPFGDPFRNISLNYIMTEENLWNVKNVVIEMMENFIFSGIDRDNRALGAYYVLGALTLVNADAATSMPWLYQSFSYF